MTTAAIQQRQATLHQLFQAHDLDGNGTVEVSEMQLVIQQSKQVSADVVSKDHQKVVLRLEAQLNQAMKVMRGVQLNSPHLSTKRASSSQDGVSVETQPGRVLLATAEGHPAMDRDTFTNCLMELTQNYNDDDFAKFCCDGFVAVEQAKSAVEGSATRKLVWALFQTIDRSGDGLVDLDELEAMLNCVTRHDKKEVAKWRARLEQKHKEKHITTAEENKVPAGVGRCELTLSDFHAFIEDYTEGNEERLRELASRIEEDVRVKVEEYVKEQQLDDILRVVRDEMTRERPGDVLAGVTRAVKRIQSRGIFGKESVGSAAAAGTNDGGSKGGGGSRRGSVLDQLQATLAANASEANN